ncbi:hypothetical protein RB599_010259 [Gaeumannomyces hyphopodioides]
MESHVDEESVIGETRPLLGGHGQRAGGQSDDPSASPPGQHRVPKRLARRLYVSHLLSTWNSRVFEFGAVLYLATLFPGTLLPMSVYSLTRGLAAMLFAPAVGHYIDIGDRLQVVRASIVFQRLAVAGSCAILYALALRLPLSNGGKMGMLILLSFLACVEKLCAIMNLVAVEKDWCVVVAGKDQVALKGLNAQMRRIDLLCKLLGPLFIALLDGYSTEIAIIVNFAMNIASVVVEYYAVARVYNEVPDLQQPKTKPTPQTTTPADTAAEPASEPGPESRITHNLRHFRDLVKKSASGFKRYFHHRAFLPSFAGALLYLTVLSFGGQMVTYLLASGFTSSQVGIARTLAVVCEVAATWVAPWLMGWIGPVRAGLWLSSTQASMLVAGMSVFWAFAEDPLISAGGLMGGTIFSRMGLRGFDLCIQIIVQEDVEPEIRGAFSTVEAAWQNAFEILSFGPSIEPSPKATCKALSLLRNALSRLRVVTKGETQDCASD